MSRIVVVGAGVGGLAAALRLAVAGHDVTVYERSDQVGGKLGRYERTTPEGTFRFDTGPSLLTLPHVFSELFGIAGTRLEDEVELVRLDPVVRHRFADGTWLDSTSDPDEFAARIGAAFGERAANDWRRLWRRAERVWRASWRDVLTVPVDNPFRLARLAWRLRDLAAIAPGLNLRGLGRRMLSDARLRTMLDRYATYTGGDPRRAPAALVAIPFAELTFGGWYLRGGLATLADALLRICLQHGVEVHCGAPVSRIIVERGRVAGVALDSGAEGRADAVVANADALHVYRDLLPDARSAARHENRSLSGFVLLLGVRGETPGLAHHNVLFPADYDAEFDAVFDGRLADDPTVFVTVARDSTVCPDGYETWFVLVNAPAEPTTVDGYVDRILAVLAERGFDVRDRLLFREVRTPADYGGAIYGTPGHGLLRPSNRGPVPGLYLVGGSVHPGGGLPMVALSARIVADMLTAELAGRPR